MTDNLQLDEYLSAAENLAGNRSPLTFENSKLEYASIVFSRIFKYSNNEVKIYDACLDGDISDKHPSFLIELMAFLKRGGKLKLALRDTVEHNSQVFLRLVNIYDEQIEVRRVDDEFRENVKNIFKKDFFFAVGDKNNFRLETTEIVKDERKAICNFNDPVTSKKLVDVFDKHYEQLKIDCLEPA